MKQTQIREEIERLEVLKTKSCVRCSRPWDDVDGTFDLHDLRAHDPENIAYCCCDDGTIVQDGKAVGHKEGICTHCCPHHGDIHKATHITEMCSICREIEDAETHVR